MPLKNGNLIPTAQTNIKNTDDKKFTNHAFWMNGPNVTHELLKQYDPLRNPLGRLIILRMPVFLQTVLPASTKKIKHLLEFANVGIDGISGYSAEFSTMTVGYNGNTIELPNMVKDDTNSLTIKVYETSGSVFREYMDAWLTGFNDPVLGYSTYHGATEIDPSVTYQQANHTMEALYIALDPTGTQPEYVALLVNMFPKGSDHSHFNYEPGSRDVVNLSLEFTATKYITYQVNELGKAAIDKFKLIRNYQNITFGDYDPNNPASLPGATPVQKGIWTNSQVSTSRPIYN